jgi:hypothetical protein
VTEPATLKQVSKKPSGRTLPGGVSWAIVVPLVVLVLAVLYTIGAVSYEVGTLASPKSGLFPAFVGILLLVSSGFRLYEEIARPSPGPEPLGPAWWRVPAICASIGVFIYLLKPAGYLIASTLLTGLLIFFSRPPAALGDCGDRAGDGGRVLLFFQTSWSAFASGTSPI